MATLPELTRRMDDDYTNTWVDIKAAAVDNILGATILTLALKEWGCFKSRAGGTYGWEDTIGYGEKSTQRFQEGSTLTQAPEELDTAAVADWRYFCVDINRSLIDDAKNQGKYQIKSYLSRRIEAARNAIVQDLETYLMQWGNYYAAPKQIRGIYDVAAPYSAISTSGDGASSDAYNSGTSNGGIDRSANTFWRNWVQYDDATQANANLIAGPTNEPFAVNLVGDMDHMYNCISANMEAPNFILTNQNIYEAYIADATDRIQIVRTAFNRTAVDMGFDAATYRGATMSYTTKMSRNDLLFLNMNHIEMNYHPDVWFEMTGWKESPKQFERVAFIVCMSPGLCTAQPRRHGVATYAS